MSIKVSMFRPDFSKTNVCKLSDDSWTIDLYDDKYGAITIFVDDSESILSFAGQLFRLTNIEKVNPYKVGVDNGR
jgi:hypothetical protein